MSETDSQKLSFEVLMIPHLQDAYTLALWLMRDPDDAEDIVQDAYLKAFRAFAQYSNENSIAWILKIVRNSCMSALARKKKSNVVALDALSKNGRRELFERRIEGHDLQPDIEADKQSEKKIIREALYELSKEFREIIVLREFQDMSYREISFIIDAPIGTVMSRLSRARKQLNEYFVANYPGGLQGEL